MTTESRSAAIRARLKHPVIDSDGHFTEYLPVVREYLKAVGGSEIADRLGREYSKTFASAEWYKLTPEQRRDVRAKRTPFWGFPAENTLDLATSLFPKLLYERLGEIGLDYAVVYPGMGLIAPSLPDEEVRRATCRALNNYYADQFADYPDRLTPAAAIPMNTPAEAIEELEYVCRRGLKVVMLASFVKRPIPYVARKYPEATRWGYWLDTYGIDSEYDYDPVWAKCQELRVVPTFHTHGEGLSTRALISNYVYNHIGHFAAAADAVCKALFLGGVTRRFPDLRFLFLEGGVGWARTLLSDLKGHWEKRSREAVSSYDPRRINREQFRDLYQRYGGKLLRDVAPGQEMAHLTRFAEAPDTIDDFVHCGIERKTDIRDLFVPSFYFGCEADDPVTASAFDTKRNAFKARINVVFGSDIGHFDVPDMRDVVAEAYEMVEEEMISEDDFKEFVFGMPARLWTAVNPDFFKGTAVESAVARYIDQRPIPSP